MSRPFSLLALALLAACASSGTSSGAVRVSGPIGDPAYQGLKGTAGEQAVPSSAAKFAAAPAAVWAALIQVYDDLGIRATAVDNTNLVIASMEQRTSKVGGRRILDYVDCRGTYGSENSYDVYLTIRTELQAAGEGSTVASTQVIGTAKPPLSNSRLACASTGGLELLVAAKLREKLGLPSAG